MNNPFVWLLLLSAGSAGAAIYRSNLKNRSSSGPSKIMEELMDAADRAEGKQGQF